MATIAKDPAVKIVVNTATGIVTRNGVAITATYDDAFQTLTDANGDEFEEFEVVDTPIKADGEKPNPKPSLRGVDIEALKVKIGELEAMDAKEFAKALANSPNTVIDRCEISELRNVGTNDGDAGKEAWANFAVKMSGRLGVRIMLNASKMFNVKMNAALVGVNNDKDRAEIIERIVSVFLPSDGYACVAEVTVFPVGHILLSGDAATVTDLSQPLKQYATSVVFMGADGKKYRFYFAEHLVMSSTPTKTAGGLAGQSEAVTVAKASAESQAIGAMRAQMEQVAFLLTLTPAEREKQIAVIKALR